MLHESFANSKKQMEIERFEKFDLCFGIKATKLEIYWCDDL